VSAQPANAHHWPVYGHDWAVGYLRKAMLNNRVRHAYLIVGPNNIGKETFALAFAMALNCMQEDLSLRPCGECRACKRIKSGNHIDMLYSETDGNSGALRIDAVRDVTNRIAMKPYEGRYRVAIMRDFHRAQPRAQDALLKTLEEPPPHAVLILLANALEPILSTITSRSQVIYLRPVAAQVTQQVLTTHYATEPQQAGLLARFSGGRIGWAIEAAHNPELQEQRTVALDLLEEVIGATVAERFHLAADLGKDKAALLPLLELWLTFWRDALLLLQEANVRLVNDDRRVSIEQLGYDFTVADARKAIDATQTMIKNLNYNLNTRLALEVMFLDYPRKGR
jgi:DNA polymerase III subunit delta'